MREVTKMKKNEKKYTRTVFIGLHQSLYLASLLFSFPTAPPAPLASAPQPRDDSIRLTHEKFPYPATTCYYYVIISPLFPFIYFYTRINETHVKRIPRVQTPI